MIITMIIVIITIVMMFLNPDQNLVFRVLLGLLVGFRAWTGNYDKGLEGSRAVADLGSYKNQVASDTAPTLDPQLTLKQNNSSETPFCTPGFHAGSGFSFSVWDVETLKSLGLS